MKKIYIFKNLTQPAKIVFTTHGLGSSVLDMRNERTIYSAKMNEFARRS